MYIHIVKANDTIWSIAREYGISAERIVRDNGLENIPYLVIGQALLILVPEVIHTVKRGESIFSIAQNYGTTAIDIYQKNPYLANAQTLNTGEKIVITYQGESNTPIYIYGYVYPNIRRNVFRSELPFITSSAMFSYGFRKNGTLIPIDDQSLINLCYQFQTVPILLLSSISEDGNFSGSQASTMFNDISLQNTVISNLIREMQQKGYLGIDIDFEYINSEDKEAFVSFVNNAAEKMHQYGFTVNVDLAPKTSSSQPGTLYEGHDYAALGVVADTVLLMTYEWGYTYGPPLAVAPINQVRKVVEYAVTQINNRKIYMGIPNYGYDWPLPYRKGITRARGIGNEAAIRIAAENGAEINFDEISQSPYFEYISRDGVKHVVWFEDVRSIEKKFDLIDEFNLRGGGYWNFMNPFAQNYMYIGNRYNIRKIV